MWVRVFVCECEKIDKDCCVSGCFEQVCGKIDKIEVRVVCGGKECGKIDG